MSMYAPTPPTTPRRKLPPIDPNAPVKSDDAGVASPGYLAPEPTGTHSGGVDYNSPQSSPGYLAPPPAGVSSPFTSAATASRGTPGQSTPTGTATTNQPGAPPPPGTQFYDHTAPINGNVTPAELAATQGGQDWGTGSWDANRVRAFFASKGVTPRPESADYWAQKWIEFGQRDPAYFLKRLNEAEEFIGSPGSPGNPGGGGGGTAVAPTSAFTNDVRAQLLAQIKANSTPFDANTDPNIRAAMEGAQVEGSRAMEMERRAMGERLFAGNDLNSGSADQQVQQSHERLGASLGTMRGTMIMQELNDRRDTLTTLLQTAIQSGDADLARQTQLAIANLNAYITQQGYGIGMAQFQANQNTGSVNNAAGN